MAARIVLNGQELDDDELLLPGEVGRLLRCDPKTVTRWANTGKLRVAVLTPGGSRRYRVRDIRPYLLDGGGAE